MSFLGNLLRKILGGQNSGGFHATVAGTFITHFGMMLFSVLVSVLITRKLDVEGRGIVSWIMAYSGFGMIFVVLGIGQASKKYITQMPNQTSVFIFLDLIMLGASMLFFMPLFYIYGLHSSLAQQNHEVFLLGLMMVPYLAISSLISDVLIGLGKSLHYNVLHIIEKSMIVILSLLLILGDWVYPVTVIAMGVIALLLRIAIGTGYIKPYIHGVPSWKDLKEAFHLMRKLILSTYFCSVASYYTSALLTIVLGAAVSARELGYYSIARFVVDTMQILPGSLGVYTIPFLVKETTKLGYEKTKRQILILTSICVVGIAIPSLIFPQLIISVLFGESFLPASKCVQIMAIGMMAFGITSVCIPIIVAHHKETFIVICYLVPALSATLFTLLFRHELDAVMASCIYSMTYLIGMILPLGTVIRLRWSDHHAAKAKPMPYMEKV